MLSVENSVTTSFASSVSAREVPANKSDAKVESTMIQAGAASSPKLSMLNNALAKADALRQTLKPRLLNEARRDERILSTQQFQNSLLALANNDVTLTVEQKNALPSAINQAASPMLTQAPQLQAAKTTVEDKVLWEKVSTAIGQIGDKYLGVYENVVGNYTDFYKSYSDIVAKMGTWISPGKDGNTLKLNTTALQNGLEALKKAYSMPDKRAVLYPTQGSGSVITGGKESDAKQWAKELGLPDACAIKIANSTWVVVIDLTPINNMISDVAALGKPDAQGNLMLDNAKYQAWQAGFKSQEENMKNTLQTLTQKYSNANSLYDNLVKVLSSTISSCLETEKSFLQS
ncbi:type III secretion system needle tip protein SctA [Obesumbacterium proteus]|uniref:type III secretion system needle tip protein SctA n=1 Tax=Obesumbacterium proteus TaxID=82983 RepID=UPI00242D8871|nr:type III secretion system needle tip protein SctA [Obesumbacterium proteus]